MQNNSIVKTCCFIGHRKIEISDELKKDIYRFIESLIIKQNVKKFLFGSRSEFNDLCHCIVTELKEKYPYIVRVGYACRSEKFILANVRENFNKTFSAIAKQGVHFCGVEEEIKHKTILVSGRAAYIERNQAMIDDSDYCLFYYNKKHLPPQRQESGGFRMYQPKSGTAIAYKYAKQKKKIIKNFYK